MEWLSANLVNIALTAAVALITGLLIRSMIRDRKAGKSSCGGSCSSCGVCGGCSACGTGGAKAPDAGGVPGGAARRT